MLTNKNKNCYVDDNKIKLCNNNKGCILIVEDNEINRNAIAKILENAGFCTVEASNGIEALEKLENSENDYYTILMDVHMPLMDGIETTKLIRKTNQKIPIIALSADITSETKDSCLEFGVDFYVCKPVHFDKLINTINEIARQKNKLINNNEINILIVDDIDNNHIVLEHMLKRIQNFNFSHAYNGEDAVQLFQNKKIYDLVFMDINMPIMNGLIASQLIKEKYNKNQIIIGITGYDDMTEHTKFLKAGIDHILVKPIKLDQLNNLITKYINNIKQINKTNNIFNYDMLKSISNGNIKIEDILLSKWKDQALSSLNNCNIHLKNNNYSDIKNIMHSIKGASYQLGANLVGDIAKNIELLLKDELFDQLEANFHNFDLAIKKTLEFIKI